ncbi:MAG: lytic transglycosylase domain-containing protein [Firmicutes bacterium]|uniref:Lytic transglycosylase n=1 Tax=Sulfobacillus benefaciens TaxID=453960 RepID=A0A2T2X831_9FIRM|nr:lytic transglycosylase domain-containing protein [Bacillota bacterium]MCL5012531.1 lytic transglycosylase domain-containing protein [Bacillota bacterium]PSR30660.1 MAG: lytic transglycosylase [Sulfobacillus benefaciens]
MAQPKHRYRIRARKAVVLWLGLCVVVLFILYRYVAPMPYRPVIWQEAQMNHLSPYLIAAVIRVESSYRPDVVSDKGAVGLMQLIPSTAEWASLKADKKVLKKGGLLNPATNIHLGSWYLSQLLKSYRGNEVLGLAAYNAGARNVQSWMTHGLLTPSAKSAARVPFPETKNFVHRVLFLKTLYRILYGFLPLFAVQSRSIP